MDRTVTVAERKARATDRRRQAIAAAMANLEGYALANGGRFLIFGSAAKDMVRHHSDLDVMIDFPPDGEPDAWSAVERICSSHAVPYDVHSVSTSSPAFVDKLRSHAIVLG